MIDIFGNLYKDSGHCTNGAGPLIGYEGTNPPNVCMTANTTPCYQAGTLLPDSLTVVRVDTANKYAVSAHAEDTCVFTLSSWPTSNPPEAGEIFVAADYTHAALFQVGAANTGARYRVLRDRGVSR